MKRRLAVFGVTLALALLAFAPGAQAGGARDWYGLTSQGYTVHFTVVKSDGHSVIPSWQMGLLELCLKSGLVMEWHITWGGLDMKVVNGRFSYAYDERNFPNSFYFAVNGRIDRDKATGSAKFLVADVTPNLKAEICTSGSPRWSATRGGSMPAGHLNPNVVHVFVIRHPDGTITRTVSGLSG
jgi:hypothetical protein